MIICRAAVERNQTSRDVQACSVERRGEREDAMVLGGLSGPLPPPVCVPSSLALHKICPYTGCLLSGLAPGSGSVCPPVGTASVPRPLCPLGVPQRLMDENTTGSRTPSPAHL